MPEEELNFEAALQRLEQIVQDLERGNLSLEASMAAFEEGMKLSKLCNARLAAAEKKVETLMQNADGTAAWQPAPN
jgi:exodeoxyribonuclease VII small subunit